MLIVFLMLTLVGAGAGAGFAMFVLNAQPKVQTSTDEPKPEKLVPQSTRFPLGAVEVPIKPLVVNAGKDRPRMLRLEGSLILAASTPGVDLLKTEIEQDLVAFLKGVSVDETVGVRGFQNLREDIDDRIKIRGREAVLGFLISGFVFE